MSKPKSPIDVTDLEFRRRHRKGYTLTQRVDLQTPNEADRQGRLEFERRRREADRQGREERHLRKAARPKRDGMYRERCLLVPDSQTKYPATLPEYLEQVDRQELAPNEANAPRDHNASTYIDALRAELGRIRELWAGGARDQAAMLMFQVGRGVERLHTMPWAEPARTGLKLLSSGKAGGDATKAKLSGNTARALSDLQDYHRKNLDISWNEARKRVAKNHGLSEAWGRKHFPRKPAWWSNPAQK